MSACASTPDPLPKAILDLEEPIRLAEGAAMALVFVAETLSGNDQKSVGYLSDALAGHVRDIRAQWRRLHEMTRSNFPNPEPPPSPR